LINLQVFGGLAPYIYIWNTGATSQNLNGLNAGTYSVTVTDFQGCTQPAMMVVSDPPKIMLSAGITTVSCAGNNDGSILLGANGGTQPLSCLWTTGDTQWLIGNLTAGSYGVTVTDLNFCQEDSVFVVTQSPAMCVTRYLQNILINYPMNVCYNATQTLKVAGSNTYFSVQNGGQATLIAGTSILIYEGTSIASGGYLLAYIAPTGPWCLNPSLPETGLNLMPKSNSNSTEGYRMYPNPVLDNLFIDFVGYIGSCSIQFEVLSLLGKRVISGNFPPGKKEIRVSLSGFPAGIYIVRLFSGGSANSFKVVKI
jgi:hypothetical protein